jgi:hypothetical protein
MHGPLNLKDALVWTGLKFIIFPPLNIKWSIIKTQDIKRQMFRLEVFHIYVHPTLLITEGDRPYLIQNCWYLIFFSPHDKKIFVIAQMFFYSSSVLCFISSNSSHDFITYKIGEHSACREYVFISFTIYM